MLTELTTTEARAIQGGDSVGEAVVEGAKSAAANLARLANALLSLF